MTRTWDEFRKELKLNDEDELMISMEKEIIRTMVRIREEKELSQAQLAELCRLKQPAVARIEKAEHSPQLNTLLRILVPMGYTLKIERMDRHISKKKV